MESSTEQAKHPLLLPRFKLILKYPQCIHEEGHIYEMPDYKNADTIAEWVEGMEKWPSHFKRLEWWEERDRGLLPRYLKNTADHMVHYGVEKGEILKVDKWGVWDDLFHPTKFNKTYPLAYVIPSTLEEYNAYLQSQTK